MMHNTLVTRMASARIPIGGADFTLHLYRNSQDNKEHLALVLGDISGRAGILARVHSECFTGDVLGSRRCDCGPQLDTAIATIVEANRGVIVYLRQEGRGIGLLDKLRAYNLQDEGYDTVDANLKLGHEADERDYTMAALILTDLNVMSVQLMTNNPIKIDSLQTLGIVVEHRVPLETEIHTDNAYYLQTKAKRMNHLLHFDPTGDSLDK